MKVSNLVTKISIAIISAIIGAFFTVYFERNIMDFQNIFHWIIVWIVGIALCALIAWNMGNFFAFGFKKSKSKIKNNYENRIIKLVEIIKNQAEDALVEKEYSWNWNRSAFELFDSYRNNGNILTQELVSKLIQLHQEASVIPNDAKKKIRNDLLKNGKLPIIINY
jgi:hypothetical protein